MGDARILVSLLAYPVTVLGPGRRVGLWTQGCSLHCEGCMSTHTWAFDETRAMTIEGIVAYVLGTGCRRVTISGGEPFDQPALTALLRSLDAVGVEDVLLYSGYDEATIRRNFPEALEYIDALVCEPFVRGMESERAYKGSENQKMVILKERNAARYGAYEKEPKSRRLQRFGATVVGIPYQKEMESLL